MEDKEIKVFHQEPGILRNKQGRIIQTGWPEVPRISYPEASAELENTVHEQIGLETIFMAGGVKVNTAIHLGSGKFSLGGIRLAPYTTGEISRRVLKANTGEVVEVCDVGGGNGRLLETVMHSWASSPSRDRHLRGRIHTTMTTLIDHEPELLQSRRDAIDDVVIGMGIELPNDDFYKKFDVITVQNSVFSWTQYPELALLNLYKMCKPDGVVLATIPKAPVPVKGNQSFDTDELMWESSLFACEELERGDEDILLRLKSKK